MTIGIGCICRDESAGDCFVLVSDKLGSHGDEFSTGRNAKMFFEPEYQTFAVCADNLDNASEVVGKIALAWQAVPDRSYGQLASSIQEAVTQYRRYRFSLDVLSPRYGLPIREGNWPEIVKQLGIEQRLHEEWKAFNIGCELIVGTFDVMGRALLYYVANDGHVHSKGMPGFWTIGSGAWNAQFWLSYREQAIGMSVNRSAYHAYEAKRMAETSPFVGEATEMAVCTAKKSYMLTKATPEFPGCAVSLTRLDELWQRFGPPDTTDLDPI